jgi:hypothetical protein
MSSKKERKKFKAFYENQLTKGWNVVKVAQSIKIKAKPSLEEVAHDIKNILGILRYYSVVFPEINSEPIKLGKLYEVTVKIGEDEAQERRLVYATIVLPFEENESCLAGLIELLVNSKKKVISAPGVGSKVEVSPVLKVIYPLPLGGYAMTPITIFNWYGKEEIIISNMEEPSLKIVEAINAPHCHTFDMAWAGSYIGRQIDGVELFDDAMAL